MLEFPTDKCLVIGEIAQAHDGSLGMAHAYIDALADAGADAIKFQTHIAAAESTPDEPWRVKFSPQDTSRYAYWKRMEFTEEHWLGLKEHAHRRGLSFLSSPFSGEAIELLSRVGLAAWKVASGEVTNALLLDQLAETRLPVLLSTGMSTLQEIDEAVARIRSHDLEVVVLQCTSMYPTSPDKVGLNMIPFFRERYGCPVGLSDHSGTIYPGLAAATLGAAVIEVHVTFSRAMFGPDVAASVTLDELKQLVEGVRFIETLHAHPVDKNDIAQELGEMRNLFTKSLVARHHLPAGTVLQKQHLALKKPGTGLPAGKLPDVIGKRLRRELNVDERIQESDLDL